ncbi:MAG: DsbA family selenoprotein, partial [Chloroflexota bacterium]|nr:DsbA family selenoprotein [Chloroflexota bacterium]
FIPPEEESVDAFKYFLGLFENRSYIGEVKRPQPPWPKGAV